MIKKLSLFAALNLTNAGVGWRKGNCPKPGSIKTDFDQAERDGLAAQIGGPWMVIADDK